MNAQLIQFAEPVAAVVALLALAWALRHAAGWLKAKAESEQKGSLQRRALLGVAALASCAEGAVNQVEEIVRPSMGDKLTPEQAKQLRAQAIAIAEAQAKAALPAAIQAAGFGDLGSVLGSLVDDAAERLAGKSHEAGGVLAPSAPQAAPVPPRPVAA